MEIVQLLDEKNVKLQILDLGIDTSNATGKMTLTIIGAIATFERDMMLERQKEGIAKAKAAGKYKGRKPTARAKTDAILDLKEQGVGVSEITKKLGISRASVYRILRDVA